MRLSRFLSPLLVLLFLVSCSRSPSDQLKTETQAVTSWAATARMVGEEWSKGNVPQAYARRTLGKAREMLDEELRAIEEQQVEGAAVDARSTLATRTRELAQTVEAMRGAVEQKDAPRLTSLLEELKALEASVKAPEEAGGARP